LKRIKNEVVAICDHLILSLPFFVCFLPIFALTVKSSALQNLINKGVENYLKKKYGFAW